MGIIDRTKTRLNRSSRQVYKSDDRFASRLAPDGRADSPGPARKVTPVVMLYLRFIDRHSPWLSFSTVDRPGQAAIAWTFAAEDDDWLTD